MNKQVLLDKMRSSALGRGFYRLKCLGRSMTAPLQKRKDGRYIASIPQKVAALSRKDKLRVLFFAQHPAYWRCDPLYRSMLSHPRFEPFIVVCGEVELGYSQMQKDASAMEKYLRQKGYDYRLAYNSDSDTWLDIRKQINPDLLFYSKPYQGTLPRRYQIDRFWDKLFCYLPYGYQTTNVAGICNPRYCQLSWLRFTESPLVMENSPVCRRNIRITGSTKGDEFEAHRRGAVTSPWKTNDSHVKRIIWAPHHSVAGGELGYSTFLQMHDTFLSLAQKYEGRIEIAFKPHPLLRTTLYGLPEWGEERTDAYYRQWQQRPGCIFVDGDYVDLFLTSDAMIHDCSSFTLEYLLTGNPVMYLAKEGIDNTLNGFGRKAFDLHYKGITEEDVTRFIEDVVIGGNDPMKGDRDKFYRQHLLPPNGKTATENMIDEILKF